MRGGSDRGLRAVIRSAPADRDRAQAFEPRGSSAFAGRLAEYAWKGAIYFLATSHRDYWRVLEDVPAPESDWPRRVGGVEEPVPALLSSRR